MPSRKRTNHWFLKQGSLRVMSDVEAAWLGAMLEAEGSVSRHGPGKLGWQIGIANTDPEVISAILRLTGGIGGLDVRDPDKNPWGKKLCYYWRITRKADIQALAERLHGYCIKTEKVLMTYETASEASHP